MQRYWMEGTPPPLCGVVALALLLASTTQSGTRSFSRPPRRARLLLQRVRDDGVRERARRRVASGAGVARALRETSGLCPETVAAGSPMLPASSSRVHPDRKRLILFSIGPLSPLYVTRTC